MKLENLASFNDALESHPTIRQFNLKAELRGDDELAVIGKVRSYHQKQIAIQLAMKWAEPHIFILTTEIVVDPVVG